MADLIALLGMVGIGSVGSVCAMLFLGFRRPTAHERELVATFSAMRTELQAIRRDLST